MLDPTTEKVSNRTRKEKGVKIGPDTVFGFRKREKTQTGEWERGRAFKIPKMSFPLARTRK